MTKEKKTILMVEDDPDVLDYISTFLKDNGYNAVTAEDGQKGLEEARRIKPDIVLLDLMMPKQSGTDFYRKLHKDKELSNIPIIVVSGAAGKHLAVPQPAAILDKPVDKDELLGAVSRVLSANT